MLIAGDKGNGPINQLGLRLGSMGTNFNLVMQPFSRSDEVQEIQFSNDVIIHFQDTRELDIFIYALQKFRSKNHEYIGDWFETNLD